MLIVGNQKTYLSKEAVLEFVSKIKDYRNNNVVICPSYLYIDLFCSNTDLIVGSQNVSEKEIFSMTGEITARQLSSMGIKYCIVGHSERREYLKENSDVFANKIKNLIDNNIIPIFCVGEKQTEKGNNLTKDVVGKQILEVLSNFASCDIKNIVIAYEPVWAIGTGLFPTNEEIIDVVNYIKDLISDKFGINLLVLYGGSVNKKNISLLNQISSIDGYLIGGASTKVDEFLYIVSECSK